MRNDSSIIASLQSILGDDFNLSLMVSIIRKSLIWIILLLLMAAGFVWLYLRYTLPVYEADSTLMLDKGKKAEILGIDDVLAYESSELQREVEIIKSKFLVDRALKTLPLAVSYYKTGRTKIVSTELYTSSPFIVEVRKVNDPSIYDSEISFQIINDKQFTIRYYLDNAQEQETLNFDQYFQSKTGAFEIKISLKDQVRKSIDDYTSLSYFFRINSDNRFVQKTIANISVVALNPTTKTIQISYKDNNKAKASDIVEALTTEFRKYNIERKAESAAQILEFLASQIDTFSIELNELQDSLKKMQIENHFLDPQQQLQNLQQRMGGLEQTKQGLEFDMRLVNWFYDYVEGVKDLKVISSGMGDQLGDYQEYIKELRDLEDERSKLLLKVTPDHPEVLIIDEKIEQIKNDLVNNLENILRRLDFSVENVDQQYQQYLAQILELPEKEADYLRINRKYKLKEEYYLTLLDKQTEFSIARAGIVGDFVVLEKVEVSDLPVSPNKNNLWLISLALALVLGVLIVAVRYLLHNTIISINDISKNTRASILGMIPTVYTDIPGNTIVVSNNPKSIVSESLRALRSNLQFISSKEGPKTIAITSTISGEGKTFLAINFGAILSFLNKKVIVLDLDMRRPRLNKIFDVPNDKGMSTILIGKDKLSDCVFDTEVGNMKFITSGPIPPNPAELILSDKLKEEIELLKQEYDYIIFDTPPLGLVTDGLDIFKSADYPIYLFRADYSSKSFVSNLDKLIDENKVNNLSVVLNDVGRGVSGYYYGYGGYGYSYGYGYGFGYYSDETKPNKSFLQRLFNR